MELSKIFNITADYKDRNSAPTWEFHSLREIVFIDKLNDQSIGFLYSFKNDTFVVDEELLIKESLSPFYQDDIIFVGEITAINKEEKLIFLANKNSVTYRYLIIASGARPSMMTREAEFAIGLQALIDALRIKPKIPSSFPPTQNKSAVGSSKAILMTNKQERMNPALSSIDQIAQPSITSYDKSAETDAPAISKRLYEVQI